MLLKEHVQRYIHEYYDKQKKHHCSIEGCDFFGYLSKAKLKRHPIDPHHTRHNLLPFPFELIEQPQEHLLPEPVDEVCDVPQHLLLGLSEEEADALLASALLEAIAFS